MQFSLVFTLTISVIFSLFWGAASLNNLAERGASDLCGEVKAELKVPNPTSPDKYTAVGTIDSCICISDVPYFIATDSVATSAVAMVGKEVVASSLIDMIRNCGPEECNYPPLSVPVCTSGNPCGFTCKDGYIPYPYEKPTQCICEAPHKECNGKCGDYYVCPSAYVKREAHFGSGKLCPQGLTACGVLGRNARTWECIDTQHELESCGGCIIPLSLNGLEGEDCTIIPGVSDVSCVKGRCVVHRCMPGYNIDPTGSSCLYLEDKDPILLAAQYGLDHIIPL